MALTYGFFNSLDGDRRYNAKQFGSIFDGVIEDGVYMGIGERFMVKASGSGFKVNVQTGRAWFDHTWTLNDAILAVNLPQPEVLLDKYVAVCIQVDERNASRKNSIVTVAGTPATNPTYPTLTNQDLLHQHPLAYCLVKAGATKITQAEITNMVGTSSCPFVTGAVQNMNIDDLVAQWESQFVQWFDANDEEFTTFMANSRSAYNTFMTQSNSTFNAFMTEANNTYTIWWGGFTNEAQSRFNSFMTDANNRYGDFMYASNLAFNNFMNQAVPGFNDFIIQGDARIDAMLDNLDSEFESFWRSFQNQMTSWLTQAESDWTTWFNHMQGQLSTDAATHLQNQIDAIKYIYVNQNRLVLPNTAASLSGSRLILSTP